MIASDDVGARYRRLLEAQGVRPVLLRERGGRRGAGRRRRRRRVRLGEPPGVGAVFVHRREGGAAHDAHVLGRVSVDARGGLPRGGGAGALSEASPRGRVHAVPPRARGGGDARGEGARRARLARPRVFEVVRRLPRRAACRILASGVVDLLFANEDEAAELTGQVSSPSARPRKRASEDGAKKRAAAEAPERAAEDERDGDEASEEASEKASASAFTREDADAALEKMLEHCAVAVVSLGARGCVAKSRAGDRGVAPGVRVPVVDTTGAGDSFTAGFLAAYLQGARLQACASCGCAVGTQMVQVLGAELAPSVWSQLASQTRGIVQRSNSVVDAWRIQVRPVGRDDPGLEGPKYNIHRTCILSIVDRHTFTFVQLISADPTICTGFSAPTSVMPRDCPPITAPASARARLARAWISRGKSAARGAPARVRDVAFRALVRARSLALALLSFATSCAGASGWRAAEHKLREQGLLHDVSPGAVTFRADAPGDDAPPPTLCLPRRRRSARRARSSRTRTGARAGAHRRCACSARRSSSTRPSARRSRSSGARTSSGRARRWTSA